MFLLNNDFLSRIKNNKVLVAVSGGVDSMVLLYLLHKIKDDVNFEMEVVHVNHNLRGVESDNDEQLVLNTCNNYGLKCKVFNVNVNEYKKNTKKTLEEAAREVRYNVIFDYMTTEKIENLIVAHNSDDQAETVLMHICRGCGIDGACGIRKNDKILRPLLHVSKKEIYDYAQENHIKYNEDRTNKDIEYTRNYIRHKILPALECVYPGVKENLVNFANMMENDVNFIEKHINYDEIKEINNDIVVSANICKKEKTVFSRLVRKCFKMLGVNSDIEKKHIALVNELCYMKSGNIINLPHGVFARKEYDNVIFSLNNYKKIQTNSKKCILGKNIIDENLVVLVEEISSDDIIFQNGVHYCDLDSIPSDSVFRTRKKGDMFKRIGSGNKSFSDYLTNIKIPRNKRDDIIVLASGSTILAFVGHDISEQIKITDGTSRFGKITIIKS